MSPIRHVKDDDELEAAIKALGVGRCSVIYFFLPWCGSCSKMNPFVESIAEKNPQTLFLKVDAEKCTAATRKHRITKVPLFVIYNSRTRVDRVEGASPLELESKVKRIQMELEAKKSTNKVTPSFLQSLGGGPSSTRMSDIAPYINKGACRVINDLSPTPFPPFLEGGSKLVSGRGNGRLLLVYGFTQKMVIQSCKIKAPIHSGPRVLRFFTNLGSNPEISSIDSLVASQEVMLSEDDLLGEHFIDLRQGGFLGVTELQIYCPENMTKSRRIEIDHLILNGTPWAGSSYANPIANNPNVGIGGFNKAENYRGPYYPKGVTKKIGHKK